MVPWKTTHLSSCSFHCSHPHIQWLWTSVLMTGDWFSCRFVDLLTIATGFMGPSSILPHIYNRDRRYLLSVLRSVCSMILFQDREKAHWDQFDFKGEWSGWCWYWIWWQQDCGKHLPSKISNSMLRLESNDEWCCSNIVHYIQHNSYIQYNCWIVSANARWSF